MATLARNMASKDYQAGILNSFLRGHAKGMLVSVYADLPQWIAQGIRNEIDFYCHRAQEDGQ